MKPTLRDSVFGKNVVKELPDNFFETVLACEVKLKKGYNQHVFQELLNYYTKAIEYYESIDDPRYNQYSQSINLLITQPEIAKHFTKEKNHPDYKLEVKKKFDNRDKEEDTNKVFTLLNQANKEEDKVNNMNGMINQEMDSQLSAFQKRREEKKKKKANDELSDKSGAENNKNRLIKKKIKITNKSEDIKDKKNTTTNDIKVTAMIDLNFNNFINEWSLHLNNKLIPNVYGKLDNEYKQKQDSLLNSTKNYATQIQESELLLENEGNKTYKDQFKVTIKQLQDQQKTERANIENNYMKITSIIQEYANSQISANEKKKEIEEKFGQKIINDLSEMILKNYVN